MKKRVAGLVVTAVLSLAALTFAGCAGQAGGGAGSSAAGGSTAAAASTQQASAGSAKKIRIGYFSTMTASPQLYVADKKGYLKEELGDVEIELIPFANGPAANEAFLAGKIDFQNGEGDLPILNGWRNGLKTEVLAINGKLGANFGLMISKKSGIKTIEELKGKKVGVYVGTSFHKSVLGILNDHGLKAKDVEIVNIDSTSSGVAALSSGELDAYYVPSVFHAQQAEKENIATLAEDSTKHASYGYWVAQSEFTNANPELVNKLFKALDKANKFVNENLDEAADLVAEFVKVDKETALISLKNGEWFMVPDEDAINNLYTSEEFLHSVGVSEVSLSKEDIDKHINLKPVKDAAGAN